MAKPIYVPSRPDGILDAFRAIEEKFAEAGNLRQIPKQDYTNAEATVAAINKINEIVVFLNGITQRQKRAPIRLTADDIS